MAHPHDPSRTPAGAAPADPLDPSDASAGDAPEDRPMGFGEPFDSGLAHSEALLAGRELAAAEDVLLQLLDAAERLPDSPDVRFLRGLLLTDVGMVRSERGAPGDGVPALDGALVLLRAVEPHATGPRGRPLWLSILLKALLERAEAARRSGDHRTAHTLLDEADLRAGEPCDDGARRAELADSRARLLMERGDWGAAEELLTAALATAPEGPAPYLLTSMGLLLASTGRPEQAEDHLDRAAERFRALDPAGAEPAFLTGHRGFAAVRRGDLDAAERLYRTASVALERQGDHVSLAVCEQARSLIAQARGSADAARELAASSLSRFEDLGVRLAAADGLVVTARQAFEAGDHLAMKDMCERARAVFEEMGAYERCAQTDFLVARAVDGLLRAGRFEGHEREALDSALALALPASLALESMRADFATGHARDQWSALSRSAVRLVFELALLRRDQGLLFELVEFRCAGAPLAPAPAAEGAFPGPGARGPLAPPDPAGPVPPPSGGGAVDVSLAAGGGQDPGARGADGVRVELPPRVLMGEGADRTALQEYVVAAEGRYRRRVTSDRTVVATAGPSSSFPSPVPTVLVRLADAGDLYMTWRWTLGAQGFGTGYAPGDDADAVTAELAAALPGPGEDVAAALADGAMTDPARERDLAARLASVLWPAELTDQIRQVGEGTGVRPLVRVQPSPRTGQVPWELLAVDGGRRLLDLADVVLAVPLALGAPTDVQPVPTAPPGTPPPPAASGAPGRHGPGEHGAAPPPDPAAPTGRTATAPAVLVLDPRVPGFRADSPLGSVLGRPGTDPDLLALVRAHRDAGDMLPAVSAPEEALRRTDQDREWLGRALRSGARRLLYVGHVTSAPVEGGQSEDARLHLCCGPETEGHAEVVRSHRPLSAKDLLTGGADGRPGAELWPSPPRVGLIACESGADARFTESFGLASAVLRNGADLVTSARWVLPTNLALHRFGRVPPDERPLSALVAAVDAAHDAPDPVRALADWQRTRLDRWRTAGDPSATPLMWAALVTATAEPPRSR
ncbi:hypothetical protein [Nocardiopsis tropica]|uniref:CHAT domain-containing protein n=1 Tax=Nocardiopsis tropica TaxID=109330 RepID=A0ABV1ZY17_9ACTN